jgi:hypothetical protein
MGQNYLVQSALSDAEALLREPEPNVVSRTTHGEPRPRIVVMRMELDVLVEVYDDGEDLKGAAEFFYNESSNCTDNELEALASNLAEGRCRSCATSKFTFLREATADDLENISKAY